MSSRNYSFLDVAALDAIGPRFARGEALIAVDETLSLVLWANGPGARNFGHRDVFSLVGSNPDLPGTMRRQIMATSGYPAIGTDRIVSVRLASGLSSRVVQFRASSIVMPDGEQAILLAADAQGGPQAAIEGLSGDGQFAALLDRDGTLAAASAGFDGLGIDASTLAALAGEVRGEADRLVKRPVHCAGGHLPAGIALLDDDRLLLMVIDDRSTAAEVSDVPAVSVAEAPAETAAAADVDRQDAGAGETAQHEPASVEAQDDAKDREPPAAATGAASGGDPQDDQWYFSDAAGRERARADNAPAPMPATELSSLPVRFVWRTDADGRFSALSDEFAAAVGPEASDVVGRRFTDVAAVFGLDPDGEIAGLLARRDTWSGRSVLWPIAGTDLKVPVDLAALPVYGRERGFEGFRGFGVARMGDAILDTEAIGLALRAPVLPPEDDADAGETPDAADAPEAPAETHADDPFQGEVPVLVSTGGSEPREAQNIIRLSERRPQAARALSQAESSNFREIGDKLREAGIEVAEDAAERSAMIDNDASTDHWPAMEDGDSSSGVAEAADAAPLMDAPFVAPVEEPVASHETVKEPADGMENDITAEPADETVSPERSEVSAPTGEPVVSDEPAANAEGEAAAPVAASEIEASDEDSPQAGESHDSVAAEAPAETPDEVPSGLDEVQGGENAVPAEPTAAAQTQPMEIEQAGRTDSMPPEAASAEADPDDLEPDSGEDMPATDAVADAEATPELAGVAEESIPHTTWSSAVIGEEAVTSSTETEEAAVADDTPGEPGEAPSDHQPIGQYDEPGQPADETLDVAADDHVAARAPDQAAATPDSADADDRDQSREPVAETAGTEDAVGAAAEPMQPAAALREAFLPSAFAGLGLGDSLPGAEPGLLSKLPLPLLVHRGDVLHYANREFLQLTGYNSLGELEYAGGLGTIFSDQHAPGDGDDQRLRLRRRDGQEFPIEAFLQSVGWEGGKALLLALKRPERAAESEASAPPEPLPAAERPADAMPEQAPTEPEATPTAVPMEGNVDERLAELRTIIDTATDGVVIIGNDGAIRSISRPAEALFGFDSATVAGAHFSSLFAMESQKAAADYLAGLAENGVASVLNDGREVIGREAQGRFIPLFMTIGRLPGDSGFCAVVRDITQWKRAEEELTQARAQAERASSQKTEFLARVSHEIRTPLNAIIGFSELMLDEKFGPIGSDRYRDYLRDINKSGNHVLDLVNDLLDISKIEAGQQEMSYEAVSLNETLAETVAMMQPQANRERVIIRSSLATRLPDIVADLRNIRQIALNLLSNAIRYTPAGGQVIVSTAYEQAGDVVMRIRDTGIGMADAEIEQALKPFKQVNALKRPRGDGTGLGLPLTKAMVEANRARFAIQSTPGEGTLVEITFPSTRVLAH